ncbi:uncharacterized protein L201_002560 [Kwoniella dendrophila CBS 6074]|uniref:ER membrane protein complex subunit 7 beta-sandwich domain-containing protein n=1 Tax=Kwoniella dendrophila CBS 6074 TaxID=1295534 RepID=A0AAX4JSE1_9TREE
MKFIANFLALLTLLPSILAVTLNGQIQFSDILPRFDLPIGSKVSINHGERKLWIKKDGSFEVPSLEEGEYILEPLVPGYIFQSYLITVEPQTPVAIPEQSSPAQPSDQPDPDIASSSTEPSFQIHVQPFFPSKLPLTTSLSSIPFNPFLLIQPLAKEDYFTPKSGLNLGGLLKSPMVLMMLFSAIMLFALPKLTASLSDMDPEMAKEMAETREKMNKYQNMDLAGSLSNMLAGSTESSTTATVNTGSGSNTPSKSGTSANAGGKKGRRR